MKKLNITINFDMDGTIADLYGVENWLDYLIAEDTTPYAEAEPLLRLCSLARVLNRLQRNGYELAVISWLSKSGSEAYNEAVTAVKLNWLKKHLPNHPPKWLLPPSDENKSAGAARGCWQIGKKFVPLRSI